VCVYVRVCVRLCVCLRVCVCVRVRARKFKVIPKRLLVANTPAGGLRVWCAQETLSLEATTGLHACVCARVCVHTHVPVILCVRESESPPCTVYKTQTQAAMHTLHRAHCNTHAATHTATCTRLRHAHTLHTHSSTATHTDAYSNV